MALPRLAESTKIYDVVEVVNKKALSEKQGGGRPPFWEMVFWWTRKPLVGARAAIMASVLPDTVDQREFLRMIGGKLNSRGEIEGTPHRFPPKIPEKYESYFEGRKLLDPFAGFGSIPLEAMRLGMDVTAVELLPTAYVFLKAVLEYPEKYGERLVEDVRRWGEWVTERLKEDKDIQELYDDDVAVYIGSWEVKCPHCGRWTPVVGNWWLARVKKRVRGREFYTRLAFFRPVKEREDIKVEVVDLNEIHGDVSKADVDTRRGVVEVSGLRYEVPKANIYARGSKAWCLHCGMEIRFVDEEGNHYAEREGRDVEWYIKWALKKYNEGDERFARQRLLVRVKVVDGDLVFEPADEIDNEKLERAKERVRELIERGDPDIPYEKLQPYGGATLGDIYKIFIEWRRIFNPRQLLTLVKLVKLIRKVGKKVESEKIAEGWSDEEALNYAEAVVTYLATALVRYVDYNTLCTMWNFGGQLPAQVAHTIQMRGIAMMWNWGDVSPYAGLSGTGSWNMNINKLIRVLKYLSTLNKPPEKRINCLLDDATTLTSLNEKKFDLVVTDPPYAYDVPYTELSDFYYVWLKRALSDSDGRKLIPRFHRRAFFRKVGAKYREIEVQWQEFAKKEISTFPARFTSHKNKKDSPSQ